jgi:cytochrome c
MFPMNRIALAWVVAVAMLVLFASCESEKPKILVFSKTGGYYHESIPAGVKAIQELGKEYGFDVDTTKDGSLFIEEKLKQYQAVVFLNTSGDVLDADQQVAFERYIRAGGGYAGVHGAAATEYEWPWYNGLVGAYFLNHPNDPNVLRATIDVVDTTHPSTKRLPRRWERNDEWYNYRNLTPSMNVVAKLDETTYDGGQHDDDHPIAWYHEYDGGRSFYTGAGHTIESYDEPLFRQHLAGGILYAIGEGKHLK